MHFKATLQRFLLKGFLMFSFTCIILLKTCILLSQFNPRRLKRLQPQDFWGGIGEAGGELDPPQESIWEGQASAGPLWCGERSASALHLLQVVHKLRFLSLRGRGWWDDVGPGSTVGLQPVCCHADRGAGVHARLSSVQ